MSQLVGGSGFLAMGREAPGGGKMLGFLRFFISRCAVDLCGQNGSGWAGRSWYTQSPRSTWCGEGAQRERLTLGRCSASSRGCALRRGFVEARLRPTRHQPHVFGRQLPVLIEFLDQPRCSLTICKARTARPMWVGEPSVDRSGARRIDGCLFALRRRCAGQGPSGARFVYASV
jgi:hypothetical protein